MASTERTGGISHGGQRAEVRYRQITGASKPDKTEYGDARLGGSYIEVKTATANTLNQVRAVKYIPLVAYHETTRTWYVVPAHAIVYMVSSKARGQHTENPFESATLNIQNLGKYRVSSEAELKKATLDAIAEAQKYPNLKKAMDEILANSKSLAARSIADVTTLIRNGKIVP